MLYFENVRLLGYNHSPVFTGAGLRYRIQKTISLQGTLIERTNPKGVGVLLSKENAILAGAIDYQDIIIAGINFGKGRITNVGFDGGTLVREEKYSYTIECYEEGDLSQAETGVYTGIDWSTLSPAQIEGFSEELNSSQAENGDLQFSHSVAIQYSQYTSQAQGMTLAKAFASALFNAYSGIGAFLQNLQNYYYAKKLYTESYNLIDCSCQFSETIVVPNLATSSYSYSLSYTLVIDEEGFLTVTENVSVTGLTSPRNAGAEIGYSDLKPNAYTRCNAVAVAYALSNVAIHSLSIQNSRTNNKFAGTIEFSTIFSNNPKYQATAIWEYTTEISRSEDGVFTVSEKGSVVGIGKPLLDKYSNALTFFTNTVKAGINARLAAAYATTGRSLTLSLVSQTLEKNKFSGSIGYSYTKTDNKLNANVSYKKVSIEVQTSSPVHLNPKFKIFNFKEIIQPQNQSTLGKVSVNIELKGSRSTSLSTFLTDGKAFILSYKPSGDDTFLQECQYNYNPLTSNFSMQAEYAFTGAKESADLTLT